MPTSHAIRSYSQLVKEVFSETKLAGIGSSKSTRLKNAIRGMIREAIGNENEPMVESNQENNKCKTYVLRNEG